MRILVVEDEKKVAEALKEGLENESFQVTLAYTGEEGFFFVSSESFDLVVLDIMLPGKNGIEILQALRKRGDQIPVLVLTAKDSVEDRVLGLNVGADDYLVKPFSFSELVARIHALLRRSRESRPHRLVVADLEMDLLTRRVRRNQQVIDLTVREFDLLEFLMRNQSQVVSRERVAAEVWRDPARVTSIDNIIDVHIARLRKKIDQDFDVKLIHTVRGAGFILQAGET